MPVYQPDSQTSAGRRGARHRKLKASLPDYERDLQGIFFFILWFFIVTSEERRKVRMKLAVTWFWILFFALFSAGLFIRNDLSAARRNVSDSQSTGEGQFISCQVRVDYSLIATVVLV